jgi:hypothetical protein
MEAHGVRVNGGNLYHRALKVRLQFLYIGAFALSHVQVALCQMIENLRIAGLDLSGLR